MPWVHEKGRWTARCDYCNRVCTSTRCYDCAKAQCKPPKVHVHNDAYEAEWRARIKEPSLEKLSEEICRPIGELVPLIKFRGMGMASLPRLKSYWNFTIAMHLSEIESFSDGRKLSIIGETAHFCGRHGSIEAQQLKCFFERLRSAPKLTDRIEGLTEYVEWMHPQPCALTPVSDVVVNPSDVSRVASWRTIKWVHTPRKLYTLKYPRQNLCYPFMPACEHHAHSDSLVMQVHSIVPKHIPQEIRGDLCQDLLVEVLSGNLTVENIPDAIGKYLRAARKFMPDNYRHISIDQPSYSDSEKTFGDTLRA